MPLISLEQFRQVLGYHPYHFWGLVNSDIRVDSACNTLLYEYNWQNTQALGREAIREALENAENKLRDYLGYSIAPKYFEETVDYSRFYNPSLMRANISADTTGRYISQRLTNGYVQAMGYEQLTLVGNDTVTYSDEDGDGLDDTFTVSIATSVTDPDKISVYFIAADRLNGEAVSDRWRISPVTVSISGGTVTITGKAWLLVRPILYEGVTVTQNPLDPTVAANFASSLAIYNRTTNPDGETIYNAQCSLIWETLPCHGWWCYCGCNATTVPADSTYDPAAQAIAIGRVGIRNSRDGTVTGVSALRNATTGVWYQTPQEWREPDRIQFRYLAGYPLEHKREATGDSVPANNGQVDSKWITAVCRMAAAELPNRLCSCDRANAELYRWQFDLARVAGDNDEQYNITPAMLDNPFGTRRGHIYAWNTVKHLRNTLAFATG